MSGSVEVQTTSEEGLTEVVPGEAGSEYVFSIASSPTLNCYYAISIVEKKKCQCDRFLHFLLMAV